ncbi:MAG: release factor glutamine methyltransferase [Lentisphaeria bacterium]|jgi:release factor glutamine methyltransferase
MNFRPTNWRRSVTNSEPIVVSSSDNITIGDCLKCATQLAHVSDSARLDIEVLLCRVLQKERSFLFTWPETVLTLVQRDLFEQAVVRRTKGEPVAYITGEREFWSLALCTSAATLIPRPDTEVLVEAALQVLPATDCSLLDLGTGTGAVALAIASERPLCNIDAVDFSQEVLELAEKNRLRHHLDKVAIFQSDWFLNVDKKYSVIVSNPPYIDGADAHLSQGDVAFEPRTALVAEEAGFADLRAIVQESSEYLECDGWLLLEHGWQQGQALMALFSQHAYRNIKTIKDYSGKDRVTMGQRAI